MDLEDGLSVDVILKPRCGSKSLKLYRGNQINGFILSHPPHIPESLVEDFLDKHKGWILKEVKDQEPPITLTPGHPFLFFGEPLILTPDPLRVKGAHKVGGQIFLDVLSKTAEKDLEALLKKEAFHFFERESRTFADLSGLSFEKVSVRDGRTRWGSCSSAKTLSYSWRLGFAPEKVARYVAAHEVAHLKEMNHSPKFWSLVERLDPLYKTHKLWLQKHGKTLLLPIKIQ